MPQGIPAPNIDAFFKYSAHDLIPVATQPPRVDDRYDPNTLFPVNDQLSERCVQCHKNKDNTSPELLRTPPFEEANEENLCFACHKEGGTTSESLLSVNAPDIFADLFGSSRKSRHAVNGTTEDGLTGAKVECSSCHNPHVVQKGETDAKKKIVDPSNTYNLWTGSFSEFCLKCHQDSANTPKETDTPGTGTYVPYTIKFPEVTDIFSPFFPGWDKTAYRQSAHGEKVNGEEKVQCNKCHRPHSSDNNRLNAFYTGDGQQSVSIEKQEVTYELQDALDDASYVQSAVPEDWITEGRVQWPIQYGQDGKPIENGFGDLETVWPRGYENSLNPLRAFLRFKLNLPKDAQIMEAKLVLTSSVWNDPGKYFKNTINANIGLIDQDNVGSFSEELVSSNNPSWSLPVNDKVVWPSTAWSGNQAIESPDLKSFINSFIAKPAYNETTGSYIGLRIDEGDANSQLSTDDGPGDRFRSAMAFRAFYNYESGGSTQGAKLKIVYQGAVPSQGNTNDNYDLSQGTEEKLCFQCHRAGNSLGAPDIYSAFNKQNSHLKLWEEDKHKDTESSADLGGINRHSECADCHDPHKAKKGNHQLGNNLASGPINGAKGVGVINGAAGTTPIFEPKQITYEYELCFKCHSSYTTGFTGEDKAKEFNPNNASYHPVEGVGKNLGIKDEAFTPGTPWNPTSGDDPDYGLNSNIEDPNARIDKNYANSARVTCTDCHGNNDPNAAKGPHGSANTNVLKKPAPDLCYQCHRKGVYTGGGDGNPMDSRNSFHVNFQGGAPGAHQGATAGCLDCHTIHGSADKSNLIRGDFKSSTPEYRLSLEVRHENEQIVCKAHHQEDYARFMRVDESYPHFDENYYPLDYFFNETFTNTTFMDIFGTTATWNTRVGEITLFNAGYWTAQPTWDAPDAGWESKPALGDMDSDGDLDMLIGRDNGWGTDSIFAYENTGNNTSPVWTSRPDWDVSFVGNAISPEFADLNKDGKIDVLIGSGSSVYGYINIGTPGSPQWQTEPSWNVTIPQGLSGAAPAIADLDADGDLDMLVGHHNDSNDFPIYGYRNTGTDTQPVWTREGSFDIDGTGLVTGSGFSYLKDPVLADLDHDGDNDLLIADTNTWTNIGTVRAFENSGSSTAPSWIRQIRWDAPESRQNLSIAAGDLNNDGKKDLMIGERLGVTYAYRNTFDFDPAKNIVTSTTVDIVPESIIKATLTAIEDSDPGTSVIYQLSRDGGQSWEDVTNGVEHIFTSTNAEQSDLRWRAILSGTAINTSIITDVKIKYTIEPGPPVNNQTPTAPTVGTPEALSTTSIRWNFTDTANNEDGFKVHDGSEATKVSSAGSNLDYLDETGLLPNTQYTRHIHAYNGNGDSNASGDALRYTLAEVPTLPIATDGTYPNKINVSWTASASATKYRVYRDGASGAGTLVYDANGTSFDDFTTGSHTYYIYSVNGDNVENSIYISDAGSTTGAPTITNSSAPVIGSPEALSTTSINWNFTDTANNEDGFNLHDGAEATKASSNSTNLSYLQESGLLPNTQYTRHVHSYNSAGDSLASADAAKYTLAEAPTIPVATDGTLADQIDVSWQAPLSSVTSYHVYKDGPSGSGTLVHNSNSTSFTDNVVDEATHTYYIYSVNAEDIENTNYISDTGYKKQKPSAPVIGSPSALSTTSINWNFTDTASNEDGFKLHDGTETTKISTATPNLSSLEETGLAANTQYTRHVHSYNGSGDSNPSADASKYTLSVAPNVDANKTASDWSNNADTIFTNQAGFGSSSLEYYRYAWDQNINHDFTDTEPQWSSGSLTKTATANGSWYLHVKSYNGDNVGNSNTKTYGPFNFDGTSPTTPTNLYLSAVSPTKINLSWQNSVDSGGSYLAGYKIERAPDNSGVAGTYSQIDTTTNTNYSDTGRNPNTKYWYRVRAYDNASNNSGYTIPDASKVTLSDEPSFAIATDGLFATQINVSWIPSATADHYHVFKGGIAGVGTLVYDSIGTSFTDTVSDAKSYIYFIYSANSENENSAYFAVDAGYAINGAASADEALHLKFSSFPATDPDSNATIDNITTSMNDGNYSADYDVKIMQGNNRSVAIKTSREANNYSKVYLRFYVTAINSQTVNDRIYAYLKGGGDKNLNTTGYVDYPVTTLGWNEVDVTSLKSKMNGYGWMKFRIISTDQTHRISEANIKLTQ